MGFCLVIRDVVRAIVTLSTCYFRRALHIKTTGNDFVALLLTKTTGSVSWLCAGLVYEYLWKSDWRFYERAYMT